MFCHNHAETAAVAACSKCGHPLCEQCAIRLGSTITCKPCLETGEATSSSAAKSNRALRKSGALAGILSMMPGMGQIYVGYYVTGFVYLLIVAATISFLNSGVSRGAEPFFGLFLSFFWIFNIIDAVRRANLFNQHATGEDVPSMPTDSPLVGGVILLIAGVLLTLGITFDMDLSFVENLWPLAVLGLAVHLLYKYFKTRNKLDRDQ